MLAGSATRPLDRRADPAPSPTAPRARPRRRAVSSARDPDIPPQRAASPAPAARPHRRDARDRRRRGVPRPARPRPARERPARPQRPLDLPHGRSGRGPRGAGGRPRPVRRRPPARRPARPRRRSSRPTRRRSSAGSSASSATTSARCFERLPAIAPADQDLPPLRLALHDWVVAWDRRTGHAWLGGRALDGDGRRLARRLDDVHARLDARPRRAPTRAATPTAGAARASARASTGPPTRPASSAIREHIARGDIYQANLTRRLETPFDGDPWALYRRLRTGDPSLFSAYLDLGPGPLTGRPRALLSASPEPFLSVDARRRRRRPIRSRAPGRAAATPRRGPGARAASCSSSAKDRAENVMIVDVLRNDLGRVCRPGTVRVPRLCRLERTAAVQHLVSTVTGRLAPGRDAFDLLAASFPGGSITGAPKIRAMEILEGLEPVRRGPYTGRARLDRAGRRDADEHPHPDVRRRRPAADPPRRRRDHLAERPGGRVGRDRRQGARAARRDRRAWRSGERSRRVDGGRPAGTRLGRRPRSCRPTARTCRSSIAASSSATGSSRRSGSAGGRPTELAEHIARLRRSAAGLDIPLPRRHRRRGWPAASPTLLAAEGLDGPDGDASVRITVSRGAVPRPRAAAARRDRRRRRSSIQAWPVVAAAGRPPRARPPPRRVGRPARPGEPARRRSRRRRGPTTSTPGSRRAGPAPTTRSS